MPKPELEYPTAATILTKLTKLIGDVKTTLDASKDSDVVKNAAHQMLAELQKKQEEINNRVQKNDQYEPMESYDFLHDIIEVVEKYKTDLEAAPGFWNKVAFSINEFFGKEIFNVAKTEFSKPNEASVDAQVDPVHNYKQELKDMKDLKDDALVDSASQMMGF